MSAFLINDDAHKTEQFPFRVFVQTRQDKPTHTESLQSNRSSHTQVYNSFDTITRGRTHRYVSSYSHLPSSTSRADLKPDNQMPRKSPSYLYYKKNNRRAQERRAAAILRDARLQQEQQEEHQQPSEQELEEVGVKPFSSCLSPSELTRGC